MSRHHRPWFTSCLLLACLLLPLALHASGQLPQGFKASYRLLRSGFLIGRMDLELSLDKQGNYRYRAHSYPIGLAAVFRDDDILELSEGRISDGLPIPNRYHYRKQRKKGIREVALDFRWDRQRVITRTGESRWSMALPTGAQDKFAQQLALMLALGQSRQSIELLVADGGRIKK